MLLVIMLVLRIVAVLVLVLVGRVPPRAVDRGPRPEALHLLRRSRSPCMLVAVSGIGAMADTGVSSSTSSTMSCIMIVISSSSSSRYTHMSSML